MNMGEKIKALREERGMTLEQLGDLVGVGKSTVRKWETGIIANMRRDKISLLANALNVSPGYLMGWEDIDGNEIGAPKDDIHKKAEELYELYQKASPEIQKAVEILLTTPKPGS